MFIRTRHIGCSHERWDNGEDLIYRDSWWQTKAKGRLSFHWSGNRSGLKLHEHGGPDWESPANFDIQEVTGHEISRCFSTPANRYVDGGKCSASFFGAIRSQQFKPMERSDWRWRSDGLLQESFEFPSNRLPSSVCSVLMKTLKGKA